AAHDARIAVVLRQHEVSMKAQPKDAGRPGPGFTFKDGKDRLETVGGRAPGRARIRADHHSAPGPDRNPAWPLGLHRHAECGHVRKAAPQNPGRFTLPFKEGHSIGAENRSLAFEGHRLPTGELDLLPGGSVALHVAASEG